MSIYSGQGGDINPQKNSLIRELLYRRPRRTAIIILAIVFLTAWAGPWHLAVMRHESVSFKIAVWRMVPADYEPSVGEYVMFEFSGVDPNRLGLRAGLSLTKRVGCISGQILSVTAEGAFYCDGTFLGAAREHTPVSQRRLTRARFDGAPIPPGKVFLVGDLSTSYDSRYWGLADVDDIYGVVTFRL